MNRALVPILCAAFVLLTACGDQPSAMQTTAVAIPPIESPDAAPTEAGAQTPELLARIGAQLMRMPELEAQILAEADMTRESLRAAIDALSQNAAAAHRYAVAIEAEMNRP